MLKHFSSEKHRLSGISITAIKVLTDPTVLVKRENVILGPCGANVSSVYMQEDNTSIT